MIKVDKGVTVSEVFFYIYILFSVSFCIDVAKLGRELSPSGVAQDHITEFTGALRLFLKPAVASLLCSFLLSPCTHTHTPKPEIS